MWGGGGGGEGGGGGCRGMACVQTRVIGLSGNAVV